MKVHINIDENLMARLCASTGEKSHMAAIATALNEYLRTIRKHALIKRVMSGETDYSTSNEELERRSLAV